ncbi:uncharacterized protein [Spinacia oleracea]|uniref:Myb-like domain-containing protein n=1 Tax=Spinacia oleracea TaxID=3562 RepID=A0A9R0IXN8_SPIOL|nr:uncharacterized protein LOC110796707 [Spinacia oleracea]XP_021857483.2 uncharacterized protein LOC110796707 [Spinacia oleracea]XP_056683517.1 uncharacterized protein LOC110796707 [Spinacia oleracea]
MSTAKVIFTYKRKRLSSCSGVGHADVCTDFSFDIEADKHQDGPNEKVRSPEKDLRCVCSGEEMQATCSSPGDYNSNRSGEKCDVQRSDTSITTNSSKMVLGSHELPGDNACKTSSGNVSSVASLGETTNSIEKHSSLRHSSCVDFEGCMQGGSVSQSVENKTEVAKGKSSAPLRTFSRRLKRKVDACDAGMFTELPLRERETLLKRRDSGPVQKSLDIKAESSDADMRSMLCQGSEKMTGNGIRASPCPCARSCAETLIMKQTEKTSNSQEDLVVDTSSVTKSTAIRTSGSVHYPDAIGSSRLQKDDVRCSSYDETVVSSCNDVACKMDKQPVSHQRGASSGDSQLTSSDSSDLKIGDAKRGEHSARSNSLDLSRPPPGDFIIDCNMVPETDVQGEASDIIQDSLTVKNKEKVMQDGNIKNKGFELFGDNSVLVEDSSAGIHTLKKTKSKPKTKCLQLFSEDGECSQFNPSNTHSVIGRSKPQQNLPFILDSQRHQIEQSSSKTSTVLGQTSKNGPTTHQFQNPNIRTCDLIQNPPVQPFPDQASLRHKLLLESINTKATSLRGNRNISLEKFDPCPSQTMWSEEELDSLWIGMRRHGRGNWHAMILDPRLRFAPWRTVADLEEQWGRELYNLFSAKHMPSCRYLKPQQDAYKLHCNGGGRREAVATETHLSLGDVYAQKGFLLRGGIGPSYGITEAQKHVTMASNGGTYACGLFNNVQASVMIRSEVLSSDCPSVAFGMNNCLPHWLKDTNSAPSRPPVPHQMGGGVQVVHAFPETSGISCKEKKNLVNTTKPAELSRSSRLQCGNPLTRKPGLTENPIVIDSDASSEETISDDNNNN